MDIKKVAEGKKFVTSNVYNDETTRERREEDFREIIYFTICIYHPDDENTDWNYPVSPVTFIATLSTTGHGVSL